MNDSAVLVTLLFIAVAGGIFYWVTRRTASQMNVMKIMNEYVSSTIEDAVSFVDPSPKMLTLVTCSEGERLLLGDRGVRAVVLEVAREHPASAAILLYVFAFSIIVSKELYRLQSDDQELLKYCSHANALVALVMNSNLSAQNKEIALALMAKSLPPGAQARAKALYQEVFQRM